MITVSSSTTAAELQSLIDNAPAGETISLGAGTFHFDETIIINRDDIAVVGAGSDKTIIELSGSAVANGAFQIGGVIDQPTYSGEFSLSHSAAEGTTEITLADASGLSVGDVLWIERPNTEEYLDSIGDEEWREDKPLRTSMVEIASIEGNVVTLKNGLAFDFSAADATVSRIEVAENVRLGGFAIDSGLGESDPSKFENTNSGYDRDSVVSLSSTLDAKLFDIEIVEAPSNGFTFAQTLFLEASNLTVDGAHNKGDGGNGYAFQLKAVYDSTLAGLEAYDTRHAVLFASWTSEVNNTITVRATNRDINFHGGPDHDNVVVVGNSVRTEKESTYMSPTLFVNDEGTSYGAPTDIDANIVLFDTAYGTNKAEVLVADADGSDFYSRAGADTLIGGAGNDRLNSGKSDDTLVGSAGYDILIGDVGTDRLFYAGDLGDYTITRDLEGNFVIHKPDGSYDIVSGVESFVFKDSSETAYTLDTSALTHFGTSGADRIKIGGSDDIVLSGAGFDRIVSSSSFVLADENEALELTGTAAIDGTGTDRNNTLTGNEADNFLSGLGGDDRFFGRGGNDYLSGGAGNDDLYAQAGNDRLDGGAGFDQLFGGSGADIFVFSKGHDQARDFSVASGDRVGLTHTGFDNAEDFFTAFDEAAYTSGDTLDSLGFDVEQVGEGSGYHVNISFLDADGEVMSMSLYGTPLHVLLANSDWIA